MAVRVGVEVETVAEAVFVLKQAQAIPVEAGVLRGAGAGGPLVGLGGFANNNQREARSAHRQTRTAKLSYVSISKKSSLSS